MTTGPRKAPSSTRVLMATLRWGGLVTASLAVLLGTIGWFVGGAPGLWSALAGVLLSAMFLAITGISILIANRWFGDPLYVPIFFGIVLGGWLLKFVLFLIILFTLRGQPWLDPMLFFISVVASIVGSLAVDVIAMLRIRTPYVDAAPIPDHDGDEKPQESPTDS